MYAHYVVFRHLRLLVGGAGLGTNFMTLLAKTDIFPVKKKDNSFLLSRSIYRNKNSTFLTGKATQTYLSVMGTLCIVGKINIYGVGDLQIYY